MSAERDLATAIYREITQPERVIDALEVWRNPQSRSWTEFDRMAFVLCRISAAAIDRVLARRQSEAARDPGRWEEAQAPIKNVGPEFAAFLSREMSCAASGCRWQWYANDKGSDHFVWCKGCGSAYPWRDTYYLRRLFEAGEAARDPGRWEPDRDALGRLVRAAWIRWARTQPSPKASWLVPYDELSEPDKEADRQIGEAIRRAARDPGRWDGSILAGTNRDDTP